MDGDFVVEQGIRDDFIAVRPDDALIEAGVSDGAVLHGADDVLGSHVIREVDEVFPVTELERARS